MDIDPNGGVEQMTGALCSTADKDTQQSRTLFYRVQSGFGMTDSLTLGGELYVNTRAFLRDLSVRNTRIADVADGVNATDAVNVRQLQAVTQQISSVSSDALKFDSVTSSYNAARGGNPTIVSNVATPVAALDAANKSYVDTQIAPLQTRVTTLQSDMTVAQNNIAALQQDALLFDGTSYSAARNGAPVRISNVANGVGSNDAVNVGQLNAVDQRVTNVDNRVTTIDGRVTAIENNTNNLNGEVSDLNENALKFDGSAYNAARGGSPTRIANVADGVGDQDAVNVRQLNAVDQRVTSVDNRVTAIDGRVTTIENQVSGLTEELAGLGDGALKFDGNSYNAARNNAPTRISNVAAGTNETDAVNVGQLNQALAGHMKYVSFGPPEGADAGSTTQGADTVAIGQSAAAMNAHSTAVGARSKAQGEGSSAFGAGAEAGGPDGAAFGREAYAAGRGDTAIGAKARVTADESTAVGYGSLVEAASSTAVGAGAHVAAAATNAVALGAGSTATEANTVSVGTSGGERRIVNVAAGISRTDAVNVGQLSDTADALNDRLSSLSSVVVSARKEARQGIAAAMALTTAPMPSAPGRLTWAANLTAFKGEKALGASLAYRLDTPVPIALTAGYAWGGGNSHGGRVGLQGEF